MCVNYTAKEIGKILDYSNLEGIFDLPVQEVSIDSRTLITPSKALFFALPGEMHDGHQFIDNAYSRGVRNFVVLQSNLPEQYPEANFFVVNDVLSSLQKIATHHQESFPQLKKIGITGSNGKTIIKEWLYQMLHDVYHIVKSPKSYNSQIGMALSLLGIENNHELGIFEAGISRKGEMTSHLKMLDPDIGLITNIGGAHDLGFSSRQEKLEEKMILFKDVETLIFKKDDDLINAYIQSKYASKDQFTWGNDDNADLQILTDRIERGNRYISLKFKEESTEIKLRFSDQASFENCMHCIAIMLFLGLSMNDIKLRINKVSGLHMRMEMTSGMSQSIIINDAYSADLDALQIALEFVKQQAGNRDKLAILSAFDQSGKDELFVFNKILDHLDNYGFKDLIYISKQVFVVENKSINVQFYYSKEDLLDHVDTLNIRQKAILIKGARQYELEKISDRLSEKGHSAALHINLNALEHNLRTYKKYLNDGVGLIAVVKASAYGTGSLEIAQLLERNGVNYLAVAFADEGISLRRSGIETDIMVFNPDLSSLPDIVRFRLEPEVYNLLQLKQIAEYTRQNNVTIHIHLKLDTGMHRLGFLDEDLKDLCEVLSTNDKVVVKTIFSHLASSEDANDDEYTQGQFRSYDKMYGQIAEALGVNPKRHILNSGGISRFPAHQYEYVRLGIGMYGIDNNPDINSSLRKVHQLNASLIQIKKLKKGNSIGYNRKTILDQDKTIGIVNIGYADGVMRNLGNGHYSFKILDKEAKILGNVCMDVTIVDLSNIPNARVGDNVVIFDDDHAIENLALTAGTIPYEILSRISTRVSRKFIYE